MIKTIESKFIKIKCPRCNYLQITFGKASIRVKCRSCNKLLIKPRGGKAKIKAQIKRVI
ncbi:MAG: 30S ribosomal protein S27e [Nanoarchaeota archaeon]|nr:30S ribosomal protein S27e [Nanoarchaeota archaeon]